MPTLPLDAVTGLMANVAELTTNFWPLIALAISIPLGFYVISKIISLVTRHSRA